jgi:ABC-type uncharacterized transport system substrate-binding protein
MGYMTVTEFKKKASEAGLKLTPAGVRDGKKIYALSQRGQFEYIMKDSLCGLRDNAANGLLKCFGI